MRIAIGCDHEGYEYKEKIKALLAEQRHDVKDFGTDSTQPVDYPDFVRPAAEAVAGGECERGIVLGACRVAPGEATAFRRACLSFFETICDPTEDINQSKFLTLSVVGFAECVKKTAALYNLPMPPWAGRLLFRELPGA